jgi:hypothetical protein
MTHDYKLEELVLEAFANGHENVPRILQDVMNWAGEYELVVADVDVIAAIKSAIHHGYAQAYFLSPQEPYALETEFSMADLDDLWLGLTPKGRELVTTISKRDPSASRIRSARDGEAHRIVNLFRARSRTDLAWPMEQAWSTRTTIPPRSCQIDTTRARPARW